MTPEIYSKGGFRPYNLIVAKRGIYRQQLKLEFKFKQSFVLSS
jgi:hypothetical protein